MEYAAAVLEARGHEVTIADLRFSRSLEYQLRTVRPSLVRALIRTQRMMDPARYLAEYRPGATKPTHRWEQPVGGVAFGRTNPARAGSHRF